jgi:hypothetical protein
MFSQSSRGLEAPGYQQAIPITATGGRTVFDIHILLLQKDGLKKTEYHLF